MTNQRIALVLFSTVTFFSSIDLTLAGVHGSGFEGTRQSLRDFCLKQHGQVIEGHKRTTCITVVGDLEIVCRDNGRCTRRTSIVEKVEDSANGGSLSSPSIGTFYEPPKKGDIGDTM